MTVIVGALVAVVVLAAPSGRVAARVPAEPSGSRWARSGGWRAPLADVFERADLPIAVDRAPRLWAVIVVIGAVLGFTIAATAGIVVGSVAGVVGPPVWVWGRGDRRRRLAVAAFPELLELVARGLRGGADLRTALAEAAVAAPLAGRELTDALTRADAGASLGEALDHWVRELEHPDAIIVRAVVLLGDETGAAVAMALDRAAATLRERAAQRDEVVALTAQTRASSMVVALAPLAFLVVVATTDRRAASVLFTTGWGRVCLGAGLALEGLGVLWMRRLIDGVGR